MARALVLFVLLAFVLLAAAWIPASAQAQPGPPALFASLSDEAEISLLTIAPGEGVHEVFGHSALRVRDPARGLDRMYNYGTFDFSDPLFVPKFVYGQLDYFLSVTTYAAAERVYRARERSIVEQRLNLTPAQRDSVFQFLQTNAEPANRGYQYDFFFDNCSTRIRDVLEAVLGDRLRFDPDSVPRQSFRQLIAPYGGDALNLGMDALLGIPADRIATPREATFLPHYLKAAFDGATITENGQTRPLVAVTDTLYLSGAAGALTPPPPRSLLTWPVVLGWALFALGLLATGRSIRRFPARRRLPDALLLVTVGLVGLVVAFMTFVSQHAVTNYNMNVLWAWPTHLVAAAWLIRGHRPRLLRGYLLAAVVVGGLLLVGWPVWPQALPAALFPIVLLLTLRCAWQAHVLRKRASEKKAPAEQSVLS